MKKTLFLLGGLLISVATTAQVKTPALSPKAEVEQTVGLTEIEVDYYRPSLRGRDMHKDILPEGKKWRFGANKNTTISFDTEVNFGGTKVAAGEYAMYALVGEKEWTITLYNGTDNWGLPANWDASKVVAETVVPVTKNKNKVETFTISFDNLDVDYFDLVVEWEHTKLPIRVDLPTKELATASIQAAMKGSPSGRDYYDAANYYLNANIELESALEYINKSIAMHDNAPFYYIRNKALILGAMGRNEEAIETAKLSLKMAKEAGSEEYVRKNEESIKKWSK
ncbi:DUF2911 domain-containing protein [Brumimicrobium oceani]|nr:DUF2911 domain-containing protein [Brumimicrobium oceani]